MPRKTIEQLAISLSADISGLKKSLSLAEGNIKKSSKNMEGSFKGASAGLSSIRVALGGLFTAAALKGFVSMARDAGKFADEISDASKRLGIGTTALQEYQFALTRVGASSEDTLQVFEGLNRVQGELRAGIGRTFTFLQNSNPVLLQQARNVRTAEGAFKLYLEALRRIPNAADRAALANKLFGSQAQKILDLLHQDVDRLIADAHRLGVIISPDEIERAADYSEKIDELSRVFSIKLKSAVIKVLPAMSDFLEAVLEFENKHQIFDRLAAALERTGDAARNLDAANLRNAAGSVALGLGAGKGAVAAGVGGGIRGAEHLLRGSRTVLRSQALRKGIELGYAGNAVGLKFPEFSSKMDLTKVERVLVFFGRLEGPLSKFSGLLSGLSTGFVKAIEFLGKIPLIGGPLAAVLRFLTLKVQLVISGFVGLADGALKVVNAFGGTNLELSDLLTGLKKFGQFVLELVGGLGDLIVMVGKFVSILVQGIGLLGAVVTGNKEARDRLVASINKDALDIEDRLKKRGQGIANVFSTTPSASEFQRTQQAQLDALGFGVRPEGNTGGSGTDSGGGDDPRALSLKSALDLLKQLREESDKLTFENATFGLAAVEKKLAEIRFEESKALKDAAENQDLILSGKVQQVKLQIKENAELKRGLVFLEHEKELEELVQSISQESLTDREKAYGQLFDLQDSLHKAVMAGLIDEREELELLAKYRERIQREFPDLQTDFAQSIDRGFRDGLEGGLRSFARSGDFKDVLAGIGNQVFDAIAAKGAEKIADLFFDEDGKGPFEQVLSGQGSDGSTSELGTLFTKFSESLAGVWKSATDKLGTLFGGLANSLSSIFRSAVSGLGSVIASLAGIFGGGSSSTMQILSIIGGVAGAAGGALGGASGGTSTGQNGWTITRAAGGPVSAGMPYIVGEEGPEWFVPQVSGRILSNRASFGRSGAPMGGPGGVSSAPVNIQVINNAGADVRTEESSGLDGERQIRFIIDRHTSKSMSDGKLGRTTAKTFNQSRSTIKRG